MKINGFGGPGRATEVYRRESKKVANPVVPASAPEADSISISPEAREIQALAEKLAELPDVREQRVQELRQAIASGTYQVPPDKVADAILRDLKLSR